MPSQPLTFDYAATGLAHALSRRYGNRTAALSVPKNWDGNADSLLAAVDTSATSRGHSAVVNLIQHAKRHGGRTSNIQIYLSAPPTNADKGMYIEQVHGDSYLNYLNGSNVFFIRPSHESRHGTPSPVGAGPRYQPDGAGWRGIVALDDPRSWWADVRQRHLDEVRMRLRGTDYAIPLAVPQRDRIKQLLGLRLDRVWTYRDPMAGHVPNFALPAGVGVPITYTNLAMPERALFDSIFVYGALALVPTRLTAAAGAPVSGLTGHNVGAILASEKGEILSWGLNFGQLNATLHAEVSLIKAWQARRGPAVAPPAASRLYTSLEPCFMCAGQIAAYRDVPDFTIIHVQHDPKFHPLPTFLTDAGFRTYDADMLNLRYRSRAGGGGWQARLAATQARLALNAPPGAQRASYQQSAIAVLNREVSQSRRFAKAAWDLARMGETIRDNTTWNGDTRGLLWSAWSAVMRLLVTAGGHVPPGAAITALRLSDYLREIGGYIDRTAHQNALRAQNDPAYRARAAGVFLVNPYTIAATPLAERLGGVS